MPFTLTPTSTAVQGQESAIRGRLKTGAYMGPEALLITSEDGRECRTHVHSHGMEFPKGWPVLPEHFDTVVILYVPRLPEGFSPISVTGLGAIETGAERIDVTHLLALPEFWAMQLALHFTSEDIDDPALEFLGIQPERANEWYESNISSLQSAGRWPYVRIPLPDSRYIELEMAAAIQYQDRVWIGHLSGSHRVLLGYHSGHFSLPALRPAEVAWLTDQAPSSASPLLWLSAAYLEAGTFPVCLARELVSHIPGAATRKFPLMADTLLEHITVSGLRWSPDPILGWVDNWDYSQRNPKSPLSILSPPDFAYIRTFFP